MGITFLARLHADALGGVPSPHAAALLADPPAVLEDYLRHVDWDETGTPIRLRLPDYPTGAEVVIDPRFGWGTPVLAQNKVKVEDVVALWRTGEPITAVAEEYNLAENVVEDVLRQAA